MSVAVGVAVDVLVGVGISVGVLVGVGVAVAVLVDVGVGVGSTGSDTVASSRAISLTTGWEVPVMLTSIQPSVL